MDCCQKWIWRCGEYHKTGVLWKGRGEGGCLLGFWLARLISKRVKGNISVVPPAWCNFKSTSYNTKMDSEYSVWQICMSLPMDVDSTLVVVLAEWEMSLIACPAQGLASVLCYLGTSRVHEVPITRGRVWSSGSSSPLWGAQRDCALWRAILAWATIDLGLYQVTLSDSVTKGVKSLFEEIIKLFSYVCCLHRFLKEIVRRRSQFSICCQCHWLHATSV